MLEDERRGRDRFGFAVRNHRASRIIPDSTAWHAAARDVTVERDFRPTQLCGAVFRRGISRHG